MQIIILSTYMKA